MSGTKQLYLNASVLPTDCGTEEGTVFFSYDSGTLTVSGTGAMKDFTADNTPWYSKSSGIKKVVVEDGVTSVGSYAFLNCTVLTGVSLPDSLTSIGNSAFLFCCRLPQIAIPDGVSSIGNSAFAMCSQLGSVSLPTSLKTVNSSVFSGCAMMKSLSIPASVTTVSRSAFYGCTALEEVVYTGTAAQKKAISIAAGNECLTAAQWKGLEDLNILVLPDGLKTIGARAFAGTAAQVIEIPEGVTSIDEHAFDGCRGLQYIINYSEVLITAPSGVRVI